MPPAGALPLVLASLLASGPIGQAPPQRAPSRPFEILDNSFLVEEAFNQEARIFQNIFGFFRGRTGWDFGFTQEWPLGSQTHQFSFTLPFAGIDARRGIGDVMINYRYQALTEGAGRPAFSPRLSVILPSGSTEKGLGGGEVGWQINLPFSKQRHDVYFHWNGGVTLRPGVAPHLSASAIWRVRPMVNLMLENVLERADETTTFTLSPGVRGGWNLGNRQVIVGLAAPVTWGTGSVEAGAFVYFSYELPFRR